MTRTPLGAGAAVWAAAVCLTAADPLRPQSPAAVAPAAVHQQASARSAERELLDQYCVTCHNDKRQTAGLSLESADVDSPARDPVLWETVVAKLRAGAMPPAGMRRPERGRYIAFVEHLEAELDRAAAARPEPGAPVAHRLTRVEYANAIRDLFDLEIDVSSLLPADNVGYGFDGIGEVLSVSPLLMERYMFAAERISRLVIGSAKMQPGSERYVLSTRLMQQDAMSEDLPFGSQGGTVVRHVFPADGEYEIRVTLQKNADGFIRGLRTPHHLDVRVDGTRVKLFAVGGETRARSGPIFTENQNPEYAGDPDQVEYEFTADAALVARFPAKAGSQLVGVTILEQRVKPVGFGMPRLVLKDFEHYKGGSPQVETVTVAGPFNPTGVSETPSRRKVFSCRPVSAEPHDEEACGRQILSTLARRAFRRPVTSADVDGLLGVYRTGRRDGDFEGGIELAIRALLAGPDFLFRIENEPPNVAPGTPYRITDINLASRLASFLWASIPDDELLDLAARGRLNDPVVLDQQVDRMLRDERSRALVTNFAGQWLSLRDLDGVEPNWEEFPDFDVELRDSFKQETERLVESTIREDRSILELLDADYTFVNERLARHYRMPNVFGPRFRRVQLTDPARRGLLGHGSILTVTSYANRTSPVLRGKWILERLLDLAPPPPPADVPSLEEKNDRGEPLTMRAALEQHRSNAVCASCHKLMDPFGFALENFDAVGSFRTVDPATATAIDASGMLYDGSTFGNVAEFRAALLKHSDRFVHTAVKNLLTYATRRPLAHTDMPVIRKIMRGAASDRYRWSSLIVGVIKSAPFQMRRSGTS